MRFALAIAVVAVAWAAAVYVHQRTVTIQFSSPINGAGSCYAPGAVCSESKHPTWADPVAVLVVLGGLAVAVGIVRPNFAEPS